MRRTPVVFFLGLIPLAFLALPTVAQGAFRDSRRQLVTENVWTYTQEYALRHHVPYTVLGPIVNAESRGDPTLTGIDSNGCASTGLLQLNACGEGGGLSVAYLQNPKHNLDVGTPYIRRAVWHDCPGMSGYALVRCVAGRSGHSGFHGETDGDLHTSWVAFRKDRLSAYRVTVASPFNFRLWTTWTNEQGRPPIPHLRNGHLTLPAGFWTEDPVRYGAPIAPATWHRAQRPGGAAFMSMPFQNASMICRPRVRRCRWTANPSTG